MSAATIPAKETEFRETGYIHALCLVEPLSQAKTPIPCALCVLALSTPRLTARTPACLVPPLMLKQQLARADGSYVHTKASKLENASFFQHNSAR